MAAHSKRSPKGEKPSTKPIKKPTTPEEAAELLTSALSYCEDAGVIVEGYNEGADLVFRAKGFQFVDGKVIVTPIGVTMV